MQQEVRQLLKQMSPLEAFPSLLAMVMMQTFSLKFRLSNNGHRGNIRVGKFWLYIHFELLQ